MLLRPLCPRSLHRSASAPSQTPCCIARLSSVDAKLYCGIPLCSDERHRPQLYAPGTRLVARRYVMHTRLVR